MTLPLVMLIFSVFVILYHQQETEIAVRNLRFLLMIWCCLKATLFGFYCIILFVLSLVIMALMESE